MPFATQYKYLYKTAKWRMLSIHQRHKKPRCEMCGGKAEIADHIKPHKGDKKLFFDPKNLQSLCKKCHDSYKSMIENGKVAGEDFIPENSAGDDGMPDSNLHPWNK